jgi:hypothetical protein
LTRPVFDRLADLELEIVGIEDRKARSAGEPDIDRTVQFCGRKQGLVDLVRIGCKAT